MVVHGGAHSDDVVDLGGCSNVLGMAHVQVPSMHAQHIVRRVGRDNLRSDVRSGEGIITTFRIMVLASGYLVVKKGICQLGDVQAHPGPVGAVDDDRAQLPVSLGFGS